MASLPFELKGKTVYVAGHRGLALVRRLASNYDPEYSHVVAALIRRFPEARLSRAKEVVVWSTGGPRREFLYVDDLSDACIHLMKAYSADELVNIGTGEDITIAELARAVVATVGYAGQLSFDASRPEGAPRKLLDVSRLAKLGRRTIGLEDGIRRTDRAYRTKPSTDRVADLRTSDNTYVCTILQD
jgi:GDP-L-fucose synthase